MKKITQRAQSKSRSIHQPPASGQRPKLVTRQNVRTAVAELIDYHQRFERFFNVMNNRIGHGFTCAGSCPTWTGRRLSQWSCRCWVRSRMRSGTCSGSSVKVLGTFGRR